MTINNIQNKIAFLWSNVCKIEDYGVNNNDTIHTYVKLNGSEITNQKKKIHNEDHTFHSKRFQIKIGQRSKWI